MNNRFDQFLHRFKSELGLYFRISAGIFLFILFFQPFPLEEFTFNNHILFVAGTGVIIFLTLSAAKILIPLIFREISEDIETRQVLPPLIKDLFIIVISATAMIFYLRYAGQAKITFFIAFKVVLIAIGIPVILSIHQTINSLRKQNDSLVSERRTVQRQIEKFEEDYLNKSVEFRSENTNENLILHIAEVAFIRSADNYVEIVFKEGSSFKKKLIRNTLKNMEQQIRQYSNFLRCHRICIVNVHFIENLQLLDHNYWLTIKDFDEKLPVSRQYLLKLKESL